MRTERADINQVLAQMRSLREQMQPPSMQAGQLNGGIGGIGGMERPGQVGEGRAPGSVNFSQLFRNAVDQVNDTQQNANTLAQNYELGVPGVDITQVMVATQKANVSFQAAVQVRNKLVSAYQDIMNMQI